MDEAKIARRIARECLGAGKDIFTVMKPLRLKKEGPTRVSIENAKAIKNAGYEVASTVYDYDAQKMKWNLFCTFSRAGEVKRPGHTFEGLSWGYRGEGPRGLLEFGKIFGLNLDENKVLGKVDAGLPEAATVSLEDFR